MSKIKINKIYNESCLKTLKRIPNNFVDLVITSPPYNLNLRIREGKYCSRQIVKEISTKYKGLADNLPIDEYYKFHSNVLSELLRVSNRIFYVIQIVTGSKKLTFCWFYHYQDGLIAMGGIIGDPCIFSEIYRKISTMLQGYLHTTNISISLQCQSICRFN